MMLMSESYRVGQVLYVLDDNSLSVKPVQVVEEVQKKTLQGTFNSYIVQLIDKNGKKTKIDLAEIKHELFLNPKKLKETMIKRATESITNLVNSAVQTAEKEFEMNSVEEPKSGMLTAHEIAKDVAESKLKNFSAALEQVTEAKENVKIITLPDGSQAKLHL